MSSFNYQKASIFAGFALLLGLGLFFAFSEYSRLGVMFLFEVFVLLILWAIDKFLLPEIDLVYEIVERKNVALVLFILGLIALPLLAS